LTAASSPQEKYQISGLKAAVSHFLVGRLVSAGGNFLAAILVVRALEPQDYAVYLTLTGLSLILGSITSLGLIETVQRFVPELYVRGQRGMAGAVMLQLLWLRSATLAGAVLAFYAAAPLFAGLLEMAPQASAFRLACPLLAGMPLFIHLGMVLESIMLQRQVKWLWMLVSLLRLSGIVTLAQKGLNLGELLILDAAVYGLGSLLAGYCLLRNIERHDLDTQHSQPGELRRRMTNFAFFNYLMAMAGLFQSNALTRVVAARFIPGYALAELSFAQAMADMIYRYMPQILLVNTLRPAIMARFAADRDTTALNHQVNAFLKLNLFLLAPLLLFTTLCGDAISAWISHSKYPQAGSVLTGFILLVAVQCHYRKLELQAQAVERNSLLLAGNLVVFCSLFPAALLASRYGAWSILTATLAGCLGRDLLVGLNLSGSGLPVSPDWRGLLRLLASAGATYLLLLPFVPDQPGHLAVATLGLASGVLFLAAAFVLKPFSDAERSLINSLLGRRLFYW
jgi:O-antigen/teichoic acid export membrane protein